MQKALWAGLIIFLIATPQYAQETELIVESNHSTIGFRIDIAGFTAVTGKFTDFTIYATINEEDFANSRFSAIIQTESINTGISERDAHLRTEDFFHVEAFPTITFITKSIKKVDETHYRARGSFTMHGITKQIELPFEIIKREGSTIGFKIRTVIDRIDFEVGKDFKHSTIPDFLARKIDVEIDFWTKRKKSN